MMWKAVLHSYSLKKNAERTIVMVPRTPYNVINIKTDRKCIKDVHEIVYLQSKLKEMET